MIENPSLPDLVDRLDGILTELATAHDQAAETATLPTAWYVALCKLHTFYRALENYAETYAETYAKEASH
jgi:hypothetical protein